MTLIIYKNKVAFLSLFLFLLLIAALTPYFLPERFFYDADTIVTDPYNEAGFIGSYPLSMLFYKVTKLRGVHYSLVAILQFPILFFILYKIGIPRNFYAITIKNGVVYLAMLMMAVFIAMPSKEFLTFIYVSVIVFLFQSRLPYWLSLSLSFLLMVLFGAFFRPYFILIPIIAIGMFLLSYIKLKNKNVVVVSYGLLIAVFLSLSYGLIKGEYFSASTREGINDTRINAEASNSLIISPVDTDTWYGETVGIIYGFFSVNLPINGLKHILLPQIVAFIIWQLLLFWILIVRFSWCLKERKKYKYELWVLLIIFAYFIVQGVFEPDLGSAVRHKIGMFPLIYYALYYDDFRKKIPQPV
jgi:hypothetical protein